MFPTLDGGPGGSAQPVPVGVDRPVALGLASVVELGLDFAVVEFVVIVVCFKTGLG